MPMILKPESSRAGRSEGPVSIGLTRRRAKQGQALVPAASPWGRMGDRCAADVVNRIDNTDQAGRPRQCQPRITRRS